MYPETQIVYSVCKISNTKHNVNLNCNPVRLSTRLISFKLEFPCLWMKMRDCKNVPKKNENAYKPTFFVDLKISDTKFLKFVLTNRVRTTFHTIKELFATTD